MIQRRFLSSLFRNDRRRTLSRIVVVLLAGIIVVGLADGSCDPLAAFDGLAIFSAQQPLSSDACAGSCVPDCFCCSTTVPAAAVFSMQEFDLPSEQPVLAVDSTRPGFPPGLDHVPIPTR
jgi:hypothetical protein